MPLLLMMAVGLLLRVTKVASKDVWRVVNRIVYYVGLPCLIFNNLIKERGQSSDDWQVILLSLVGTFVLFAAMWIIMPFFVKDPKRRGAITQASVRSNDSIFSLTVAASLSANASSPSSAASISSPALSILALTHFMNLLGTAFLPYLPT